MEFELDLADIKWAKEFLKKIDFLSQLTENHYFGEISLVHPVPASATVTAEVDSDILLIDKENLDELFQTDPAALDIIHKKIEERNNKTKS